MEYDRFSGKLETIKSDSFTLVKLDSVEISFSIEEKEVLTQIESRLISEGILSFWYGSLFRNKPFLNGIILNYTLMK